MRLTKTDLLDLTYRITGAAIDVHKLLGPGLTENVYHRCFEFELKTQNIMFNSEMAVPVEYKGVVIDTHLRCDLFIENIIVVELKAVESILPIHEAQLLTYMKLLKSPKGILLNFNVMNLYRQGQRTFVNELYKLLPE